LLLSGTINFGDATCYNAGGVTGLCSFNYADRLAIVSPGAHTLAIQSLGTNFVACSPVAINPRFGPPPASPDPPAGGSTTFDAFNPLLIEGSPYAAEFQTPAGILNRLLGSFLFPIAGMILFVMLIWGGFETLLGATGSKKDAGKQRATTAVLGFILLFASYWIAQLVQAIFGVRFLG